PRARPSPLFPYTTLFRSGALPREALGGGAADAARGAGHDRDTPAEPAHAASGWRARKRSTRSASGFGVSRKQACPLAGTSTTSPDRKSTRLNSSHVSISY